MRSAAKVPELRAADRHRLVLRRRRRSPQAAGLSREMGALFAGMSIAAFPYGADVAAKLAGIRDFFVTLFFVSLGLKLAVPTVDTLRISLAAVAIVVVSRLVDHRCPPPGWCARDCAPARWRRST